MEVKTVSCIRVGMDGDEVSGLQKSGKGWR